MKTRGVKPGSSRAQGQRVRTPDGLGELITAWRPQRSYLLAHKAPRTYYVVALDAGRRAIYPAELIEALPDPEGGTE